MQYFPKVFLLKIAMLFFILALNSSAFSQIDTLSLQQPAINLQQLPLGKSTYLVYEIDTAVGSIAYNMNIWERKVSIDDHNIVLNWTSHERDNSSYILKELILNKENPKPINEKISYSKGVTGSKEYRFFYHFGEKMLRTDPDSNLHNYQEMQITYDYLAFSWEFDLETFSMLDYEQGKQYAIPFYHPAGDPPAYYSYRIDRKENINMAGQNIMAWVIAHEDSINNSYTEWWLNAETFQVLKMKNRHGNKYRYKFLIHQIDKAITEG